MKLSEYEQVKDFTYLQYCDYLQKKYGLGSANFMTKTWKVDRKAKRTSEGLLAHHKFEDHAALLANEENALNYPYEWQMAENIVYCDYLEHLLLHVLICEYPAKKNNREDPVGIGGVLQYLVPELNDLYSGWDTNQAWRKKCHDLVRDDKETYLVLVKRFKERCARHPFYSEVLLYSSFNEKYGVWSGKKNARLFEEIRAL